MQKWAQKPGFTIVELLIVIVVIAILAAITIVAYNGIQNRAKDSAVNTAASQAGKKVLAYAPTNTDRYPTEANFADTTFRTSTLSLPADSDTATYDYYASDDQKSFCLSVTNTTTNPLTAYAMTQSGQVVQGRCVKNLAVNPGIESSVSGWSIYTGVAAPNRVTTTPAQGAGRLSAVGNGSATNPRVFIDVPAQTGDVFSTYYKVRSDGQAVTMATLVYKLNNGTTEVATFGSTDSAWSADASGWVTGRGTSPALPSGGTTFRLNVGIRSSVSYPTTGTMGLDSVIILKGSQQPTGYADGDSLNWSWSGAQHTSTSFGPMVF
jgi:prepilin-type N-terminal cleavage/methylation domain-containing protein